ncbi:putative transcriptional regulator protein [Oceanicola granulosus HTCC2516]|uniref:Putative transcriptional regulator protein n=1 Tax=Oceanicola granulosus (strain ATCC BAA-861 / DSM 15982 / KCTC 12143 / HTCC2516) TaxID=314256 RepID=Q2CEP6_OCEGH|nr:sugar-binding transcriptional regulator [Oceanicola granulosus]EAR51086.1 putative transcriptional regulator protein [Oceanicola granulosus HTCC2516]
MSDASFNRPLEESDVAERDRALMLRAAWLYFIEERTQSDIADALGVSRFRVNRMLADCREQGLVRIEVTAPMASCVELEQRAKQAFGLRHAVVVPTPVKPERTHAMIGAGLARYMSEQVADADKKIFGIGWGQTMREMLRHLRPTIRRDARIVALLGAPPRSSEENAIDIIGAMGRLLQAERYYMTAPIYADTPEARYVLTAQQFYADVKDLIMKADVACFAAGDMSEASLLIRHALPPGVSVAELTEAGAVGDILGTFIDIDGRPVDHPINRQLVGPGLSELRGVRPLVMASGGTGKVPVVTAALRSGHVEVLVTDEATMRAVLKNG